MIKRIIIDIFLFFAIIFFPWHFSIVIAFIFSFLFESYFEIILWGIILDALYAVPIKFFFNTSHFYIIISLVILVVSFFARKKLSFYPNRFS